MNENLSKRSRKKEKSTQKKEENKRTAKNLIRFQFETQI